MSVTSLADARASVPRASRTRFSVPLPKEGEDGLFTQSWYPICMSSEVGPGEVKGVAFLDGKVVAVRGESGEVRVLSAYCPHLGSDLSVGKVIGDRIQCAFHSWQYDLDGVCVDTARKEPPPPQACLYNFPTVERYGMIWAFNGDTPHWQLPDLKYADDDLFCIAQEGGIFPADPVAACANTPDYHHFRTIHGLSWDHPDPDADRDMLWTDTHFRLSVEGTHWNNWPFQLTAGIHSTTLFVQESTIDGKWFAYLVGLTIREPGSCFIYNVVLTHRGDRSPEAEAKAREIADWAMDLETQFIQQDAAILAGIKFRQGTLTRTDKPLAKYLDLVRAQPRGHPSRDFIR
jgi:nitrite reductase/ring-hydroxylating ferredoxin subunit